MSSAVRRPIALVMATVLVLGVAADALADPRHRLRFATLAPDGTAWARIAHAFERDVARNTEQRVEIKFYFGGVAGTDDEANQRLRRGQLDGIVAGNAYCESLMPSMRVLNELMLYRSRAEWNYVVNQLHETFHSEISRAGFIDLSVTNIGPMMFMSRTPVRSLSDLRRLKLWIWDTDLVKRQLLSRIGLNLVTSPLAQSGAMYDDGRADAFLTAPMAALALQWSVRAKYFTDLRIAFQPICFVVAQEAMDSLPIEFQNVVRSAAVKMFAAVDQVGEVEDEQLLGGLLERQGMKPIRVTDEFYREFAAAARLAREQMGDQPVPSVLLKRVETLLANYRAAHPSTER